ncbi:MAG: hypothetical protein IJI38_06780 [Clostridia bacterium]|nr:hypothetical protein [Clostridia bacterium]
MKSDALDVPDTLPAFLTVSVKADRIGKCPPTRKKRFEKADRKVYSLSEQDDHSLPPAGTNKGKEIGFLRQEEGIEELQANETVLPENDISACLIAFSKDAIKSEIIGREGKCRSLEKAEPHS